MVEVSKFGDKTIVIDSRYISIFKAGKLLKKVAYMPYELPDGNRYKYRRPIIIIERSGKDLTNYQVKIEIVGDDPIWGHARSDGADIRFCYYEEEQMLNYWIEKYDPTNKEAIIWVKVPSIPANSKTIIFMYYGNREVASASDGEATFDFFDDFNTKDTDKWIWNNADVKDGYAYTTADGGSLLSVSKPIRKDMDFMLRTRMWLAQDYDIDYRLYYDNSNYILVRQSTWRESPYVGKTQWKKIVGGSENILTYGFGPDVVLNEWFSHRMTRIGTNYEVWCRRDSTGEEGTAKASITDSVFVNNDLQIMLSGQHANDRWDYVIVGKYTYPEPLVCVCLEE